MTLHEDGKPSITHSVVFETVSSFQSHGEKELAKWKLARVSEDFRVIALGLPVPGYQGNPLDPPLRSRFQARDVPLPLYQVSKLSLLTILFFPLSLL